MTKRQKLFLALFILFCLVVAGLRVYSIMARNQNLIEMVG